MRAHVSLTEKVFFTQNLQVMLRAGLSLSVAINTLAEQTENRNFKKMLRIVRSDIEKGVALSSALAKYPHVFSELFVNMVHAGEVSGKLEDILQNITSQLKKEHDMRAKIKNAMAYPVVVVCVMIGIGIAMLTFVVPRVSSIFEGLNTQLPLPTRVLIGLSHSLVQYGVFAAMGVAAIITLFSMSLKNKTGRRFWHRLFLRLPIAGPIIKKINIARFTRVLGSLLKTDVPITQSVQVSANTLGNAIYQDAVLTFVPDLTKGTRMAVSMARYVKLFPPLVTQMVSVGEETGTLSSVLEELASFYEEDVDNIMKRLPSIVEPLLMVVLGVGVGAMAISIILPMYNLTQAI